MKFHGQGIEVRRIEHHIPGHHLIKKALVLLADIWSRFKGLVPVVVMRDDSYENPRDSLHLVVIEQGSITAQFHQAHDYLSKRLPTHMVQTVWLRVEGIPTLASAKADRTAVAEWIANLKGEVSAHNALRSKCVESD